MRLTFTDRIDIDDALDTMQVCVDDALSFEPSVEEMQPADAASAGPDGWDTEEARYALTVRMAFTDRVDADDVVDRMEYCILKALSVEPSIEEV